MVTKPYQKSNASPDKLSYTHGVSCCQKQREGRTMNGTVLAAISFDPNPEVTYKSSPEMCKK